MIRRYLLVVALALLSSKALAQTGRTVHSIGFLGGSNTATYNGQQATFLYSGGEVVVQNGYIEIAKDQASVVSGMPFDISYFPVVFDRDLFVSKGYFSEYVQLEWNIVSLGDRIKKFRIFRKPQGQEGDSLLVAVLGADVFTWRDPYADKGTLYKYTLFAEGIADDLRLPYINVMESTGFSVATGTVSGRITYEGGTAVEGVNVLAETAGALSGKSIGFNGTDAYLSIPHRPEDKELELSKGFTFQAWLKYQGEGKAGVLRKGTDYELSYEPGSLTFKVSNATLNLPFTHPVDSFFHVTAVFQPGGELRLHTYVLEGKTSSASVTAGSTPAATLNNIEIGRNASEQYFKGVVDEVRLWSRPLTVNEISRDFARYLAGSEADLVGYWRLNEGTGDRFYDISRKGFKFFENHGYIWRSEWSSTIPLQSQLAYRGVTDAQGNYVIAGFPYETTGSLYTFTPLFGVHQFEPNQQLRFVGDGASIHNGVDFKDVSSFKVTGTVRYYQTKFPVEGVSVLIDGKPAVSREGELILTDNLGRFTVDVPIGPHSLRVDKSQHIFVNGGRFPEPEDGEETTLFDYQSPLSGLEFIDSTLVKVAGRVVGGPVQAAKELGFGRSKNNLGKTTIFLTTQKAFDITDEDRETEYAEDHFTARASLSTKFLEIETDDETGEYVGYLLPEKYVVTGVTAGDYVFDENSNVTIDLERTLTESTEINDTLKIVVNGEELPGFPPYSETDYESVYTVQSSDTVWTIGYDQFEFNARQDFILRLSPVLEVTNEQGNDVFGEAEFMYVDKDLGIDDRIPLIEDGQYTFGHPVFFQRSGYQFNIKLYEEYVNKNTSQTDQVPVVDGAVEVVNELAINTSKVTIPLNSQGKAIYRFTGGLPEINQNNQAPENSFTRTISITGVSGDNGAIKTIWRNDDPFRGFLFGGMPTGNNFVTTGPTEVTTILRDPPGSNSYAYLEKGEVFSTSKSWSNSNTFSQEGSLTLRLGMEIKTFAGVGAGVIKEVDFEHDIEIGLSAEESWISDSESVVTIETTKAWSTSGETDYVGADGDVFVGYATNIVYGKSLDLQPIRIADCNTCSEQEFGGYRMGLKEALRIAPQFSTAFLFSQSFIENTLLPNLEEVRNNFLSYSDSPGSIVASDKAVYISLVPLEDEKFGSDNHDKDVWGANAFDGKSQWAASGPSYVMKVPQSWIDEGKEVIDSVWYFNRQIKEWKYWLGENERRKLKARLIENISFDAGASYEQSITVDTTSSSSRTFEWFISPSVGYSTGQDFDGFGLAESLSLAYGHGESGTTGSENGKSSTYGFALADGDAGDYMTIDVKDAGDGFGPVFYLRAGATSCPYEDAVETKYFTPGKPLGDAPLKREKCEITVAEATKADVPENRAAEFRLFLANNSETSEDVWYDLKVDESTNPNGAVLEIDGQPIANGRSFFVTAGQLLEKTLKVWKGSAAELNYEGLSLVLISQCDENIADTVQISAFFQPGCSDIALTAPKDLWVMNTNITPEGILPVEISNYDLNYAFFKKIIFQYKAASSSTWISDMIFYNRNTVSQAEYEAFDEPKAWIDGPKISYSWDMSSLPDRDYEIRAITICELGPGNEAQTPSETLRGTKDVKRPKLFGAPQPADGILSAGDEISIRFDEPIEAGLLTPFNFSLQGVLNSYELNHNTSVNFDGTNDFVKVEDGLNLNSSFTIEFWLKRDALAANQVVFSKGYTATDRVEIGFGTDNKLFVNISGQNITTSSTFTETDWHHYAVVYEAGTKQLSAYKDDKYVLEKVPVTGVFSGTGPFNLGKSVISGDGFLNGNLHELRIWSKALNLSTVYADMYLAKTGTEVGLVGYWPMDEAFGNKVLDKARFRHGLMFADWEVLPKGKAMKFDGTDDYLQLNTASTVVVTPEMDYTIEFWFKALASPKQSVIFSSGKGDGSDTFNGPDFSLSVGMTAQGAMFVQSNGQLLSSAAETSYGDSNWHHFALSLSRNSNVNMFVDGVQIASAPSTPFGGLAGATMWVGARGYKTSAVDVALDQHFAGSVDDIRIWKMAKKLGQLDLNRTSKLNGDETGLVAYYPFEYYALNTGVRILTSTLADQWANPFGANGGAAVASGGAAVGDDAPNLKDARPVTKVDFDWAVNGDQIIITPSQAMAGVIEKTILEIAVTDVEDKNENRLASPASWTAFVDRNQLKWGDVQVSIEKKLYQAYSFEVEVVNFGGTEQRFSIDNMPAWLRAVPSQGVLPPRSASKIKFTVNEGLNTGYYSHDLYLSGDFGFDEKLQIDVRVFEDEPQWNVNPANFQYSMNVIAQLKINGIISRDSYDKVAAFVNGECRGVGNLQYIEQFDQYQLYLDIYSNSATGENIELRVWDASNGVEHRQVKPDYKFTSNTLFGSPAAPEMIEADETYLFPLGLSPGWSWVSFNLVSDKFGSVNTFLGGVSSTAGDQVKSQTAADVYAANVGWTGSLSTSGGLKPGEMYMMKIQKGGSVEVIGKPAPASTEIAIKEGWNWIGVIPQFALSVNEALASYGASNGDIVKGKTAFATYRQGLGWIGSLTNLKPGEGYLLKAAKAGTLVYPAVSSLQNSRFYWEPEVESWQVDGAAYADNMNIIATVSGIEMSNIVVGAFVDGICRGYASPMQIDPELSLLFLTVQGLGADKVTFRALDLVSGEEWLLNESLDFLPNLAHGSFDAPAAFTVAERTAEDTGSDVGVYPNPFSNSLKIRLPYVEQGYELRITDLSGRFVSKTRIQDMAGHIVFEWDIAGAMHSGLYVLSVSSGDEVFNFKVVKE